MQPSEFVKTYHAFRKAASDQYALAVDPPETNFTDIAIPVTNYPPEIVAMPDGPRKQLAVAVLDLGSVIAADHCYQRALVGPNSSGKRPPSSRRD